MYLLLMSGMPGEGDKDLNQKYSNRFVVYILLLSIIFSIPCFGQNKKKEEEDQREKFFSLGAQLLGPTMIAGYVEFTVLSRFFLSGALGVYKDYQLGINYSLMSGKKRLRWYPYLGVHFTSVTNQAIDPGEKVRSTSFYIPFGLRFESKSDFIVSLEIGYNFIQYDFGQINTQRFMAAVRFGTFF